MIIFVLEALLVAFFIISRTKLSLASYSESAGCGLRLLFVLVQASGDFLSFLFIECSPCLWHPSSLSVLDSVPGTAPCSAFSSVGLWEASLLLVGVHLAHQCSGSCSIIGGCAFHSVVLWELLCYWWLCIPGSVVLWELLCCWLWLVVPDSLHVVWTWPRSLSHGAQDQPGQRKCPFEQYIQRNTIPVASVEKSLLEALGRFLKC